MRPPRRRLVLLLLIVGATLAARSWWLRRADPTAPPVPATPWPPVPEDPALPAATGIGVARRTTEAARRQARGTTVQLGASVRATRTTGPLRWVPPVDGRCPPTHPVKAKERSRIYHLPGMAAYARTVPDRCYASGPDAEADGFRAAKH